MSQSYSPGRILIADDDPLIVQFLTTMLTQQGFEVASSKTGNGALSMLSACSPDVVILDVHMPDGDGIATCAALRSAQDTRLLPVVFLTGMPDRDTKLKCIEAGGNDFLNKPVDAVEMLARVRSLTQLSHALAELESVENVVLSFVRALEAKDPYTQGHSERVAIYTSGLAETIGFPKEDQNRLYQAGLFHDIGKIAVREVVLHKEGALNDEEFREIKSHTVIGEGILKGLRFARGYLPAVRHHHERWDGKGYPDGLAGESIPLDARLMAIADAFDAMTSTRPYRSAMPLEQARGILRENRGPQWDAELLPRFLDMIDERGLASVPTPAHFSL